MVQEVLRLKNPALQTDCAPLVKNLVQELQRDKIHEGNYRHSTLYARLAEGVVAILKKPDDDVATLCSNLGNFYTETGDLEKALQAYQQMADLQTELLEVEPVYAYFKNNLAISYARLGQFNRDELQDSDQSKQYFRQAEQLLVELLAAAPQYVDFQRYLERVRQQLED